MKSCAWFRRRSLFAALPAYRSQNVCQIQQPECQRTWYYIVIYMNSRYASQKEIGNEDSQSAYAIVMYTVLGAESARTKEAATRNNRI